MVDLDHACEGLSWPFLSAGWLAIAVPVAMWTRGSISWFSLSILMLGHLVLMIIEVFASLVDSIIDLWRLVILVGITPLLLICLLSSWSRC